MEERTSSVRPRIPSEKKRECLELFEKGNGYKRTASITGLNAGLQAEVRIRGYILGVRRKIASWAQSYGWAHASGVWVISEGYDPGR